MTRLNLFLGAFSLLALASCHSHAGHDHDHAGHDRAGETATEEHSEEPKAGSGEIMLPPEKAEAAGVVSDTVRYVEFSSVVPVSGQILPASGDETTVAATVAGIVKLSRPLTEGASVSAGTPLFSISTSSLADGDVSQRAAIAYQSASTEYERARKLIEDQLISQKEFTAIKAEYDKARIAYNAVGKAGSNGIRISAPVSGFVKEYMVKDGDFVEVGQPMLTLTRNHSMYLRAELPEKDFQVIDHVVSAKFRTSYSDSIYNLANLNGHLLASGKATSGGSSYIPLTFEFNYCPGVIPGAFAEVYLVTSQKANVIALPQSALTEEQGVYYVYVRLDEDCYRKQEVRIGGTDGEMTEIIAGIHPGEVVVTKGAIHVKLASAGKSIPGHTHNH